MGGVGERDARAETVAVLRLRSFASLRMTLGRKGRHAGGGGARKRTAKTVAAAANEMESMRVRDGLRPALHTLHARSRYTGG